MNPHYMELMIRERQKEMIAEAERLRLIAAAFPDRPSIRARFLMGLGETFIRVGLRLKARYGKPMELSAGYESCS